MTYERLIERPADGTGVAVGQDDWAFIVEALLPESDDSLWAVATWNDGVTGTGLWSEVDWVDITPDVRGVTWTRGAEEFGGRPKTGTLTVTVSGADWSPFGASPAAAYFAPGTIIRVGVIEAGPVLVEPFDDFTTNGWTTSGTPTIVSGRTGTCAQVTSNTSQLGYTIPAAQESDTITIGFALNVASAFTNTFVARLMSDDGTTTHLSILPNSSGIDVALGTTTPLLVNSTAPALSINTWYYVEVQARLHSTLGFVTVRVDGVETGTYSGNTRNGGTKATFDALYLRSNSIGQVIEYDDLYLWTGADAVFRGDHPVIGTTTNQWIPQIAGIVESWPQQFVEAGADSTIEVTAVETTATLAEIDANSTGLIGAGDSPYARLSRLLGAAAWPFGLYGEGGLPVTALQSTDMADNRLTECHLSADSADLFFMSHRSGIGILREADPRSRPQSAGQLLSTNEWENDAAVASYPMGVEFRPGDATLSAAGPGFDLTSTTNNLTAPDATNLDIVGDITVIVELDTFGTGTIASKWGAAGQRSWKLAITSAQFLAWSWTVAGTTEVTLTTTVPIGGVGGLVAVEFDVNNGAGGRTARFWKSFDEGKTWQVLQSVTSATTTSIFSSTAVVALGGTTNAGTGPTSRYRRLEVRTGIGTSATAPGGTTVLEVVGDDVVGLATTATSFTATTGQTVTVTGTPVLPAMEPVIIDGTDPFVVANDLEAMVNDVRFARAGGTQQTAEDATSIGRWRKRITYSRSDLITSTDADVLAVAEAVRDRRSNVTLRPVAVTVVGRLGQTRSNLPALFIVDVGTLCVVTLPDLTTRVRAAVANVTHQIGRAGAGLWWRATFGFDVFSEATA